MSDIYSLTGGSYIPNLMAVDNTFVRQLAMLAFSNAKNGKMVSVIYKNILSERGEVGQKGVSASEKSVLDICKLSPLGGGLGGAKTTLEEIAAYRWGMLNFDNTSTDGWKQYAYTLMVDYLFAACVCYVEVFEASNRVDKFFATRNKNIAALLTEADQKTSQKWVNFLTPLETDYSMKQLRMLKLTNNKNGWKVTQPRSAVNLGKSIRVTPLFLLSTFVEGISEVLKTQMVKFTYVKDNMQERELVSTLSSEILEKYYGAERTEELLKASDNKYSRGYVRLPELGASRYDYSGVRALNISRITSIEVVQSFDERYLDVDFEGIIPMFKNTVEHLMDINALAVIFTDLCQLPLPNFNGMPTKQDCYEMQNEITSWCDIQYSIGSTTFQRSLHSFMVDWPSIFNGYTGKKVSYSSFSSNFNLGAE